VRLHVFQCTRHSRLVVIPGYRFSGMLRCIRVREMHEVSLDDVTVTCSRNVLRQSPSEAEPHPRSTETATTPLRQT